MNYNITAECSIRVVRKEYQVSHDEEYIQTPIFYDSDTKIFHILYIFNV